MALTRKAILIGNNLGHQAPLFLSGVNYDLINYNTYLQSGIGGSWLPAEIEILKNKTRAEIKAYIDSTYADYTFIVYSGHGFVDRASGVTYMCVKDGFLSEKILNTHSNRQTLIFDCCRSLENLSEDTSGFFGRMQSLEKGGIVKSKQRIINNSRIRFNRALEKSSFGKFKAYACLIGETSGDNPNSGGVFLTELLKVANSFGHINSTQCGWMDIRVATRFTIRNLINNPFTNQNPTFLTIPNNMALTAPFALTNYINPLL
jgi:hypothetical protein